MVIEDGYYWRCVGLVLGYSAPRLSNACKMKPSPCITFIILPSKKFALVEIARFVYYQAIILLQNIVNILKPTQWHKDISEFIK